MTGFRVRPLDETTWPDFARLGGGTVESYPEDTEGRSVSASFLHNGTVSMFEGHGFERVRRLGTHHWVVARVVPGATHRATSTFWSSSRNRQATGMPIGTLDSRKR